MCSSSCSVSFRFLILVDVFWLSSNSFISVSIVSFFRGKLSLLDSFTRGEGERGTHRKNVYYAAERSTNVNIAALKILLIRSSEQDQKTDFEIAEKNRLVYIYSK